MFFLFRCFFFNNFLDGCKMVVDFNDVCCEVLECFNVFIFVLFVQFIFVLGVFFSLIYLVFILVLGIIFGSGFKLDFNIGIG